MNLCVALGETTSVLQGVCGIHILVTPDCLGFWEMQRQSTGVTLAGLG
jgi:hypothetical protein